MNHLLNITGVNGTANNNTSSLQNTDNNDFDINSDNISSVESILTGLGIPLLTSTTSTAASLNCDTNFLSDSTGVSNNNNDLINCLLVHGNQNNQHVTTSMGGTATTPNGGGGSSVGIGLISDDRSTSQIGRLHKEFVRIPRLPHELLTQLTSKYMKSSPNYCHYHQSDNLTFWHWASRLMEEHASRKSELEIQFIGKSYYRYYFYYNHLLCFYVFVYLFCL